MKKINLKIITKKAKSAFVGIGSDADKDWKIVLSLFSVALVVSLVIHINIYINTSDVSKSEPNKKGNVSEISPLVLGQIVDKYEKRTKEFNELVREKSVLVDPAQ